MSIQRVELGITDTRTGCACGAHPGDEARREAPSPTAGATTLRVDGMTCAHCVASVTEEVSAVAGVDGVSVELNAGGTSTVTVTGSDTVDEDALRAAVAEAGYRVSGVSR